MQPKTRPATQETPPPPAAWKGRVEALGRSRVAYLLASGVVLIPCYWQSRLQAGDLSSHIYNAWLAQLIRAGQAPGLVIGRQSTNLLFDLMLSGLFGALGAGAAQHVAVSVAVLTFVWGAFALVSKVAGRRVWHMLPFIAMLAYGWVFHVGFFNFYLGLGLCFWAMALAWDGLPRRAPAVVLLLAAAWIAHALPVVWTLGVLAYAWVLRRVTAQRRTHLMAAALVAIVFAKVVFTSMVPTQWLRVQLAAMTGADQLHVFDDKYLVISAALLLIWLVLITRLIRTNGARAVSSSLPLHVCALTVAGIVIFPTMVAVPGYKHAIAFIADRMSLALSICVCGLVAAAPIRVWERRATLVLALVFFGFLYRDERLLNAFEDQIAGLVSQLPPGQRVLNAISNEDLRINVLAHTIDRVCIGRCFSYANYEPTTAQFRVRVVGESPIVASNYEDSWRMQFGRYVVQERDLPLYEINLDPSGRMVMLSLAAGAPCGISYLDPL